MKDLDKIRKEAQKKDLVFRTCWNCNPGHKHLKKAKYCILCLQCGHYYYKGEDITEE